jgi:hypothetical protein
MSGVTDETIHLSAEAPIIGIRIVFVKGPWGEDDDSVKFGLSSLMDSSIGIDGVEDDGQYMRVSFSGDADDMQYLEFADRVFERFSEYMPQLEIITEEDNE